MPLEHQNPENRQAHDRQDRHAAQGGQVSHRDFDLLGSDRIARIARGPKRQKNRFVKASKIAFQHLGRQSDKRPKGGSSHGDDCDGLRLDAAGKRVPCFIQVNIGAEEQKGGCPIAQTPALIAAARDADIPLLGLMCVPPADVEPAPFFALLAKMAREEGLPRLSMGMSGDYETAIMLGATDIRVGTALFGERPAPARPVPASGRGMIRNSGGS